MSGVRNHGIPKAFEVGTIGANRQIGQLLKLTTDGKLSTGTGAGVYFPLIQDVEAGFEGAVGVTVSGVAKVYVETAAGITAGVEVGFGTTGVGAAAYSTGYKLGIALDTPAGNGDFIQVLLSPSL